MKKDSNPKIIFTLGLKGPVRKKIISRMIEEPGDITFENTYFQIEKQVQIENSKQMLVEKKN